MIWVLFLTGKWGFLILWLMDALLALSMDDVVWGVGLFVLLVVALYVVRWVLRLYITRLALSLKVTLLRLGCVVVLLIVVALVGWTMYVGWQ